jgi:hypothetical protein
MTGNSPYVLAKNVDDNSYDAWDKEQEDYNQRYAKNNALSGSPFTYGANDLNYYGNFFNAPGYGMMWQPYFAGAGWNPFMDGVWAFSPGAGYGWASSYPWGWLPYHSGSWAFLPSYGWAWQPGGTWMGLGNRPTILNSPQGFQAPGVPVNPSRSLIAVGRGPSLPTNSFSNKLVVNNNSAGLGIPRGSVRNLAGMSQQAGQHGIASARIQPQAANPVMFRNMQNGAMGQARTAPGSGGAGSGSAAPSRSAPSSAPVFAPMPAASAGGGRNSGGTRK